MVVILFSKKDSKLGQQQEMNSEELESKSIQGKSDKEETQSHTYNRRTNTSKRYILKNDDVTYLEFQNLQKEVFIQNGFTDFE